MMSPKYVIGYAAAFRLNFSPSWANFANSTEFLFIETRWFLSRGSTGPLLSLKISLLEIK
jgi:hypothetical protein